MSKRLDPAVGWNGLFDIDFYRDGYRRMAGYAADHLAARMRAKRENERLLGLLKKVEFLAYQPAEVREAINSLSNGQSHRIPAQ